MLHRIRVDTHLKHGEGPFQIDRIRPGIGLNLENTGFGGLGLVDHAHLSPGLVVGMHEHLDDEIVSYLREGTLTHEDSAGNTEKVTPTRLMVMNAGKGFHHEERIPEAADGGLPVEMLQIFIRPRNAGLEPMVQFVEIGEDRTRTGWRLLATPDDAPSDGVATVRQDVYLYDTVMRPDEERDVPFLPGWDRWLYAFDGVVTLADGSKLSKGEALAMVDEPGEIRLKAHQDTTLVLFQLRRGAPVSMAGSLSRGR